MRQSPPPSSSAGLCSASKRSLSQASEALEISSRRKISRFEYSEWIISCSSCFTSAWNPSVSRLAWAVLFSVMGGPPVDTGGGIGDDPGDFKPPRRNRQPRPAAAADRIRDDLVTHSSPAPRLE